MLYQSYDLSDDLLDHELVKFSDSWYRHSVHLVTLWLWSVCNWSCWNMCRQGFTADYSEGQYGHSTYPRTFVAVWLQQVSRARSIF